MNDRRLFISTFLPHRVRVLRSDSPLILVAPLTLGLVLALGLVVFRASAGEII